MYIVENAVQNFEDDSIIDKALDITEGVCYHRGTDMLEHRTFNSGKFR